MPTWCYYVAWPVAVVLVGLVALRFVRAGKDSAHTYTHRFGELTMVVLLDPGDIARAVTWTLTQSESVDVNTVTIRPFQAAV